MGHEISEPGMQVLYRPSPEDKQRCYEFGADFAKKVKAYHTQFE
jgi:flavorubredoxin